MYDLKVEPVPPVADWPEEHDACGLMAFVRRDGQPSADLLPMALTGLAHMSHRAGTVHGEGDGAGVLIDLPRQLWADRLRLEGLDPRLARSPRFRVAHLFLPFGDRAAERRVLERMRTAGLEPLLWGPGSVETVALGPMARAEAPVFWQAALMGHEGDDAALIELAHEFDERGLWVLSLSGSTVVYKVRGDADTLSTYFGDLSDRRLETRSVIGHLRYSTNTTTRFERVQPFRTLGHNGEIDTITRLREEGRRLGFRIPPGGSDSQDVSLVLESLIQRGMDLATAMAVVFPPSPGGLASLPDDLRPPIAGAKLAFGPYAQGPAAIVARVGDDLVASVDELGLRPLWWVETHEHWVLSSERGPLDFSTIISDPRPLGPGEKLWIRLPEGSEPTLNEDRVFWTHAARALAHLAPPPPRPLRTPRAGTGARDLPEDLPGRFGWEAEDLTILKDMATLGADPIGSLGFDGPLAALAGERRNLADFLAESVAVVTNPAIDREREREHFSTQALLGPRPSLFRRRETANPVLLESPILLDRVPGVPLEELQRIARSQGSALLWELPLVTRTLVLMQREGETLEAALRRLRRDARQAGRSGVELIVLDDMRPARQRRILIDPVIGLAAVLRGLESLDANGEALRRRVGVAVRSGAIRRLHDTAVLLGLGADAVCPSVLLQQVVAQGLGAGGVEKAVTALRTGMEKVASTIGTHELRGYGRMFAAIGVRPEVANLLGVRTYLGSHRAGLGFPQLERQARLTRAEALKGPLAPLRPHRIYPRVWRPGRELAQGARDFRSFSQAVLELERERPVALRHVMDIRPTHRPALPAEAVDVSVGRQAYPLLISSMSFGSQGETAYRAYAEAADRIGILCMNGEGGEIPDLIGRYPESRGIQVASGRFGISAALLGASRWIEIKIGQGAKPGEGGHLPAAKVSEKVAKARNTRPHVDLISPSNNHDLYSIEDLAQLIDELKEVSPEARVIVKVPVVPGIGVIAVGIAKAGADVITLSGYDGGTGAARKHSARHVGLPAEIGLMETHRTLLESGLRNRVEVWCDGGMKTGRDVVKMMLLGADRVAFGTMAMVAVGCTICRACQTDTCHVGIATQLASVEEARARGLKRFVPQEFDAAVEALTVLFTGIGEEVREIVAQLGFSRARDLIGRGDLLTQVAMHREVDLAPLFQNLPAPPYLGHDRFHPRGLMIGPVGDSWEYETSTTPIMARMLGTRMAGDLARLGGAERARLALRGGQVAGQGLGAFHLHRMDTLVEGGAQDGPGKGALGGRVAILKGLNLEGRRIDGGVGKSFAYGAQRGRFYVQGDADARACIRLSGADVVFGNWPHPVQGERAVRSSNLKGFAFEYMTGGRVVCLGDPGPWFAAGMTGGVVYILTHPEAGLTEEVIRSRVALGAKVTVKPASAERDQRDLHELLPRYAAVLRASGQVEEADRVFRVLHSASARFVAVRASGEIDPDEISTE